MALSLPSVPFFFVVVASVIKALALLFPFFDDDIVTSEGAFVFADGDEESTVLGFPFVALSFPHVNFFVQENTSFFKPSALFLPLGNNDIVSFDRDFEFFNGLFADSPLAVDFMIFGLHLVVLLVPHVAFFVKMLAFVDQFKVFDF